MKIREGYDYADAFALMCQYYLSLMDGDDHMVDEAFTLMRKHGIVDEDGFPIDEDEEE